MWVTAMRPWSISISRGHGSKATVLENEVLAQDALKKGDPLVSHTKLILPTTQTLSPARFPFGAFH
jgi:hypothetical protein